MVDTGRGNSDLRFELNPDQLFYTRSHVSPITVTATTGGLLTILSILLSPLATLFSHLHIDAHLASKLFFFNAKHLNSRSPDTEITVQPPRYLELSYLRYVCCRCCPSVKNFASYRMLVRHAVGNVEADMDLVRSVRRGRLHGYG